MMRGSEQKVKEAIGNVDFSQSSVIGEQIADYFSSEKLYTVSVLIHYVRSE